jgi:ABC-type transport system involved in multi-copper enzyme maturation permease subunit
LFRIWAIWQRDLEDAVRNSTFLLVLIGPVLCSILFFRVSQTGDFARPTLGLVGSRQEGLGLLLSTSDALKLRHFESLEQGLPALKAGEVDGLLEIPPGLSRAIADKELPSLRLRVGETGSVRSALLCRVIEEGARTIADQEMPIDLEIDGAFAPKAGQDWTSGLLSSWLVFTAMSGLMIASASFIEEKEQRTLLGVLTAPVSMVELWVGKVGAGLTLALLSTLAVLLGNSVIPSSLLLLHLIAGCASFAALGILVGLVCTNQSAANAATSTLFMVIYIPLALQELSAVLSRAATLSPAFYLQRGSRALMAGQMENGLADLAVLVIFLFVVSGLGLWAARSSKRILPG